MEGEAKLPRDVVGRPVPRTQLEAIRAVIDYFASPGRWSQGATRGQNGACDLFQLLMDLDAEHLLEHYILIAADHLLGRLFCSLVELNDALRDHDHLMTLLERVRLNIERELQGV